MPIFEYRAVTEAGEAVSGTVLGPTWDAAATDLQQRGLKIQEMAVASAPGDPVPADFQAGTAPPREAPRDISSERSYAQSHVVGELVGKVPLSDLLFFFRQLSTMLKAGVGMVQTLDTLGRQSRNGKLRAVLGELRQHALEGRPMSFGMQRYPEVFSPLMLSLVRAGEEGGMLEDTLRQIADYIEREIELRNLLRRVTFYPKLVIAASIIIILATNAIIASLGKEGGISSPLTTWTTWLWLGPLIIGIFLFVRIGLPNPRVKYNWDMIMVSLPGFGGVMKQFAMAKFGRAFGALYAGGVSIPRAIELAADACGNEYMRSQVRPAAREVETGGSITDAFAATGAFSPIVLDMTRTGETTGNLDQMLMKLSEFYEQEAEVRSVQFGYAFGVLALLAVGAYVLYVVVNFYMGYFSGIQSAAG